MKDSANKKREKYETFLENVPLLSTMEPYERQKLADAFKEEHYKDGDYIISQGDQGNVFYFIETGAAYASINKGDGQPA